MLRFKSVKIRGLTADAALRVSLWVSPDARQTPRFIIMDYYYESRDEGLQKLFPQLGALQTLYLLCH